ncbi:hypothetical protein CRE_17346 [Caenorhabditis remanei]|uniref:Uncharacterized protein n=1 Tax=Caenorhabditis remanei TaxID=31234 RepID=E3MS10_CAERE|nr:hypothetical protein CRE_17346 [Caenorhabditis remanei]
MEEWINTKKDTVENKVKESKSNFLNTTIACFITFFLSVGIVLYLIYMEYTNQLLPFQVRLFISGGVTWVLVYICVGFYIQMQKNKPTSENKGRKSENYSIPESMKMSELNQRQLDLIDFFIEKIAPLQIEIQVWKNRVTVMGCKVH